MARTVLFTCGDAAWERHSGIKRPEREVYCEFQDFFESVIHEEASSPRRTPRC